MTITMKCELCGVTDGSVRWVGGKICDLRCVACEPLRDCEILNTPTDLSELGTKAHAIICEVLRAHGLTYTGGCTPFRSPAEWRARGEEYGRDSELIVVYDGGEVREGFDPEDGPGDVASEIDDRLRAIGLYSEQCTCWYSAIYRV